MTEEAEPSGSDQAARERRILRAFDARAGVRRPEALEHLVPGSKRAPVTDLKQQPFDSIGLLVCQGARTLYGTAVYCAPDAVVTARHTLMVPDIVGAWLYIGFDAKNNPVTPTKVVATALHAHFDLAVLLIDAPPREALQLPGIKAAVDQQLVVVGYGVPYSDGSMQMTTGSGAITEATDQLVGYAITTDSGDSGAPLVTQTPQGEYVVVAIHTSGATGLASGSNFGIPMSPVYVAEVSKMLASARKSVPY